MKTNLAIFVASTILTCLNYRWGQYLPMAMTAFVSGVSFNDFWHSGRYEKTRKSIDKITRCFNVAHMAILSIACRDLAGPESEEGKIARAAQIEMARIMTVEGG